MDFQVTFIKQFVPVSFGASNNVIVEIHVILLFTLHNTKNIAYHITKMLIFYADKLVVMGSSKNLRVFNFVIYSNRKNDLMLMKYTCFTVYYRIYLMMNILLLRFNVIHVGGVGGISSFYSSIQRAGVM